MSDTSKSSEKPSEPKKEAPSVDAAPTAASAAPEATTTAAPAAPSAAPESAPAAPVASTEKKGMSTGLKVFLWIFGACAVLSVIGIIIAAVITKKAADEFDAQLQDDLEELERELELYDYDYTY